MKLRVIDALLELWHHSSRQVLAGTLTWRRATVFLLDPSTIVASNIEYPDSSTDDMAYLKIRYGWMDPLGFRFAHGSGTCGTMLFSNGPVCRAAGVNSESEGTVPNGSVGRCYQSNRSPSC
jgi:hypothetical protein